MSVKPEKKIFPNTYCRETNYRKFPHCGKVHKKKRTVWKIWKLNTSICRSRASMYTNVYHFHHHHLIQLSVHQMFVLSSSFLSSPEFPCSLKFPYVTLFHLNSFKIPKVLFSQPKFPLVSCSFHLLSVLDFYIYGIYI